MIFEALWLGKRGDGFAGDGEGGEVSTLPLVLVLRVEFCMGGI